MTDQPTVYQAAKQAKIAKQRKQWMTIARQHDAPEDQALALYEQWPQRLPKVVRALAPQETRLAWITLRAERFDFKLAEEMAIHDILSMSDTEESEDKRLMQLFEEGLTRYQTIVDPTINLVATLPDVFEVVCSIVHPDDLNLDPARQRSLEQHFHWDDMNQRKAIRSALVLGMMGMGGVVIKQHLKLKFQTLDAHGERVWQPQERVYGLHVGMGELHLLTEREVRHSYSVDAHTGEPISLPVGVSFGDLKAYARQKRLTPGGVPGSMQVH